MPSKEQMERILFHKMRRSNGEPIKTSYQQKDILVSEDPFFEDFANLGAVLSSGPGGVASGLQQLEEALVKNIGGVWVFSDKKQGAISYFQKRKASSAVGKNDNFQKLLTRALDSFEGSHGFVVSAKLPIFAGFVYGKVFQETIKNRMHFKDVGAGESHGEFTHRIQWYIAVTSGALVTVDQHKAGEVYGAIHRWLNKAPGDGGPLLQLWNYLFDMQKSLLSDDEVLEEHDFRSPENLNTWLTGEIGFQTYPLLSSFLKARKEKRKQYMLETYFHKKLGPEKGAEAFKSWQADQSTLRPSARIVYNEKQEASYSPHVSKT